MLPCTRTTLHSYVFLRIARFSFLLSNLSLGYPCFYLSPPLYIPSQHLLFFCLFLLFPLVFAFWFCIFFCPDSLPPDPGPSLDLFSSTASLFFFILQHPQSHLSRLPLPRPFLFILPLICLFPHPSNPLFRAHSLRLAPFHASYPPSSASPSAFRFILLFCLCPSPSSAATFSNSSRCFAVLDLL